MKKLFKVLLVLLLCLGFAGCSSSGDEYNRDEYDWDEFDEIVNKINASNKVNAKYDDDGNLNELIIYDGENDDMSTWVDGIKICFVDDELVYLQNSRLSNNKHVFCVRYFSNNLLEEYIAGDDDGEEVEELFHPVDKMLYVYNPVEDYAKGIESPEFYESLANYSQFYDYMASFGTMYTYDFIEFCNMAYLKPEKLIDK